MTYAQGGLIQATDFNNFASTGSPNVNQYWATGTSSSGYGQTQISTVSVASLVSYTDWANLISAINNSALHQGTTHTPIPVPISNNLITYQSSLSSSLTNVYNNRLNAAAVGTDITGSATRTTDWGTNAGIPTVTSVITITFGSSSQARYFFNCGGAILVSCSRSGGAGTPTDITWTQLCSDVGSLGLPAVSSPQTIASVNYTGLTKFGGSGYYPDIYIRNGFYNLTGTPQTLFRQFANPYSYVYSSDYIALQYSFSGSTLTIRVIFNDDSTSVVNITGNLSVTAVARPPSTAHISNSWGTPVVSVTAAA